MRPDEPSTRPTPRATAPPWVTAALLALAAFAPSARADDAPSAPTSLAVLRRTFDRMDADANGFVSAAEGAKAGLPASCFVVHDRDRDGHLSRDEFTLCYRALLLDSKRAVPADIAEEVVRVRARQRAREEARRRRR